jgi:alkylation response protein AidB-like acyl-CoA dehydrogenase
MNFDLTEEQRRIRETLTDFAEREIKPHSTRWDKEESFPRHIVEQLGQLGFLGVAFPEKLGGGGADTLSQVLVVEGLSRYDASIGLTCAAHMSLSTGHIAGFASDEQRAHYVPDMLQAKKLGAWCLTEPSSGSDAAAMHAKATRVGDNYSITGSKMFITNGTVADVYVVMAITDQARGRDGVSAFIVDRGTAGLSNGKKIEKLGLRASDTAEVIFENVTVPARNLVGELGAGYREHHVEGKIESRGVGLVFPVGGKPGAQALIARRAPARGTRKQVRVRPATLTIRSFTMNTPLANGLRRGSGRMARSARTAVP